jgi:hypothetical protein
MLTDMVMATLLVNVFGVAAALPFIAAQNLLSRSLQTESRDAMGGARSSRETNGLSPSKAANRRQSSQPRRMRARQRTAGLSSRSRNGGGLSRSEPMSDTL